MKNPAVRWETPTVKRGCDRCRNTGIVLHRPGTKPPGSHPKSNPAGEPDDDLDWVASLCPEHDWPVTMTGQ